MQTHSSMGQIELYGNSLTKLTDRGAERADCTYVQVDLDLYTLQNKSMLSNK